MSIFKKSAPATTSIKMFSIRDAKVDAFMRPFFARTTPEALRIWTDSVNGETGFAKHPEDYMLFEVGAFCELTGMVQTLAQPLALCGAYDVLIQQPDIKPKFFDDPKINEKFINNQHRNKSLTE